MARTPAIAASLLLGSLVATGAAATPAHAATARIAPVIRTASAYEAPLTLIAHNGDACRMLVEGAVFDSSPHSPILPVWHSRRAPLTACQTVYEDGSALAHAWLRFPSAVILTGRRYIVAVSVYSRPRAAGSGWVRHTFVRSFTSSTADPAVF